MHRISELASQSKMASFKVDNAAVLNEMHAVQADVEGRSSSSPEEMQPSPETDPSTPSEEPASSRDNFKDEASGFDTAFDQIQQIQETQGNLKKSLEILKMNHQRDYMVILEALEEDKRRYDALKQELSDLTELHESEIWNLKEELVSTQEEVHYTDHEKAEFHEAMEACHSRLLKVELQQQHVVYLEREVTIPRTVLGKIVTVILAILTAILAFVSVVSQFIILLKPSVRMLSALLLTAVLYFVWKYREVILKHYNVYPESATP